MGHSNDSVAIVSNGQCNGSGMNKVSKLSIDSTNYKWTFNMYMRHTYNAFVTARRLQKYRIVSLKKTMFQKVMGDDSISQKQLLWDYRA